MPRTIESIVECHRVARERRAQGKPVWDMEFKIRDIINKESNTVEEIVDKSHRIAKVIRAKLPEEKLDFDHEDYDEEIENLVEDLERMDATMDKELAEEKFNELLEEIYDWSDKNRCWIG